MKPYLSFEEYKKMSDGQRAKIFDKFGLPNKPLTLEESFDDWQFACRKTKMMSSVYYRLAHLCFVGSMKMRHLGRKLLSKVEAHYLT